MQLLSDAGPSRRSLNQPAGTRGSAVGPAIATVVDSDATRVEFARRLAAHEGPIEEFWKALDADPQFTGRVAPMQLALQLSAVAQNHLPMVRALQQNHITNPAQLAVFDEADWRKLIESRVDGKPVGVPAGVPGANASEQTAHYAKAMALIVEDAFPSAVVANRLSREHRPDTVPIVAFLNKNPDFNLKLSPLDHYLQTHPDALATVDGRDAVARELRALQRVYKVAPRYAQMRVLRDAGLDSAQAVTRLSKTAFVQRFSKSLGGSTQAKVIYEKAAQNAATAWALLAEYGQIHAAPINVLPSAPPSLPGVPDLETLFGSLNLCACRHCRSVYGPAAYFVDILAFMKDRPSKTAGQSAKAVLFSRRPDLGAIELSCVNTNTPLPYIDLVNELLEKAVAPATATPDVERQTHRSAAELRTNPEYINASVQRRRPSKCTRGRCLFSSGSRKGARISIISAWSGTI